MSAFSLPHPYSDRARAPSPGLRWPPLVRTEFTAVATVLSTLQGRLTSVAGHEVAVGLLLDAPSPEGANIVEPAFDNYQRIPVTFVKRGLRGVEYNKDEIRFLYGPDDRNPAKCVSTRDCRTPSP